MCFVSAFSDSHFFLLASAGDVFVQLANEDEMGWCKGRKDGVVGLFPSNYVERIWVISRTAHELTLTLHHNIRHTPLGHFKCTCMQIKITNRYRFDFWCVCFQECWQVGLFGVGFFFFGGGVLFSFFKKQNTFWFLWKIMQLQVCVTVCVSCLWGQLEKNVHSSSFGGTM